MITNNDNTIKPTYQRIVVKAQGVYNYYVQKGNLKLYVDPLFKPGERRVRIAEVVSIPDGMFSFCDIIPEVQTGDTVYLHHNALEEQNMIPDSDNLFYVEYEFVICVIRNGEIVPIGGRILAEPQYDDDVVEIEFQGQKYMVRMGDHQIVKEFNVKSSLYRARLAYIGTPQKGQEEIDIKPGDLFFYIKNGDYRNEINGKEYFVMYQEDILAKICED